MLCDGTSGHSGNLRCYYSIVAVEGGESLPRKLSKKMYLVVEESVHFLHLTVLIVINY